jgi:hypothetical protein
MHFIKKFKQVIRKIRCARMGLMGIGAGIRCKGIRCKVQGYKGVGVGCVFSAVHQEFVTEDHKNNSARG